MINVHDTYPIRADIVDGESGHGYALRLANANALGGLPAVKAALGKSRFVVLDAEDAPVLARWFGADPDRLARALGRTGIGSEPEHYLFAGARLTRSYFVNRMQPRVCPKCLADCGICRLSWEVTLNVGCAIHRQSLVSVCPACARALRWDRPGLCQCACGWALTLGGSSPASAECLDVAGWVEREVGGGNSFSPATRLGALLDPLTLDAGLHIVIALASMTGRTSPAERRDARKRNSPEVATESIRSAAATLSLLAAGVSVKAMSRVPLSAKELLAEAAASCYAPAERQLARSILVATFARSPSSRWAGRFPQLAQLELFA